MFNFNKSPESKPVQKEVSEKDIEIAKRNPIDVLHGTPGSEALVTKERLEEIKQEKLDGMYGQK